ncbi:S8 family serine peptidase [Allostreptomyces psammosilenae]|uniref:Type VII secretion-associated serine protease mycosin n=1 Tax=Allostreptomyces psammosilenae TaxID=1892865 RepID=A0A852ZZK0_9ACTN|nr:S8 family serine peptidase [Allostreptomyces psammosilenae]NYI04011.1 type VII secretion-associated serine protease mycosin [Allostreptomyces psammosilenae]
MNVRRETAHPGPERPGPRGSTAHASSARARTARSSGGSRVRTAAALLGALLATAPAVASPLLLPAAPARAATRDWPLATLNAEEAWRHSTGEGVTVAVLDTGVDATHPDLAGRVLQGADMVGSGAAPGDAEWAQHGTAMAALIAGQGVGNGVEPGVRGIAPDADILPVRVILEDDDPARAQASADSSAAGQDPPLVRGIRWAVDHGADVINLSLGDDTDAAHPDAAEDAAVRYALERGVVVVASAGNSGDADDDGSDPASYPAVYPGVIAVSAVGPDGERADFSTRHWYTTVAAPGDDVVVADPDRDYYEGWGTSAAAAYVSGVVALMLAEQPELSPHQVARLLRETADPGAGATGDFDEELGAGVVDAGAAVLAAGRTAPEPPAAPAPSVTAATPGAAPGAEPRWFGPGPVPTAEAGGGGTGGTRLSLPVAGAFTGLALTLAGVLLARGVPPWRRRGGAMDGWSGN